ncbi:DivIVA domain-containing protein [Micromonospora sp. WMMD737]|uniref:DivIVA domain-containing protein n=1 Tax=Micromonospora sp. WMMD737 TaxID=3404113 RepID=UPI003B9564DD
MHGFLRGVRRRQWSANGPTCYRSAAYHSLRPRQVRERRLRPTSLGRRGLDPQAMRYFLDQVAGDLAAVQGGLDRSRWETDRIKSALRRWQLEQARARNERSYDR